MNKKEFWKSDATTNLIKRMNQLCEDIRCTPTWLDIIIYKLKKIKRIPGQRIRVWKKYHKLLEVLETLPNWELDKVIIHGLFKTMEITLRKV